MGAYVDFKISSVVRAGDATSVVAKVYTGDYAQVVHDVVRPESPAITTEYVRGQLLTELQLTFVGAITDDQIRAYLHSRLGAYGKLTLPQQTRGDAKVDPMAATSPVATSVRVVADAVIR